MVDNSQEYSTRPLARPFARSLAALTHLLASDCSLRSCPLLRSLVRSLAHFAHSLAHGKVNDWMSQNDLVLSHSALMPGPGPLVLILVLVMWMELGFVGGSSG